MPGKIPRQRQKIKHRTDADEKFEYIDFQTMNLVPPEVGIFDEPTRCYRINHEWAKLVMGFLSWMTSIAVWRDATHEGYIGIQEIMRFMEGGPCEMPFQLRQNPLNSCLIEQSTDGGETWLTAFDFSLCMSIVDGSNINTQTTNFVVNNVETFIEYVYNNYVNNYINNVTDIAPELGYGNADDQYRDAALCYALTRFIDSVCEAAIRYYDEFEDTGRDALSYLAMGAAVIGIVAIAATGIGAVALATLATGSAAALGIFSATGAVLVDWWADGSREMYEDESAREEIVCCLLDVLKGANFNQDAFKNAFNCSGLSVNAAQIHGAAQILAQEDATYAAMVENMRIGLNSAKLGLLENCPCESGYSMLEYDFTLSDQFFSALNASTYVAGQYWQGHATTGNYPPFGYKTQQNLQIAKRFHGEKMIVVGAGLAMNSVHDCDGHAFEITFWDEGVETGGFAVNPAPGGTPTQWTKGFTTVGPGIQADEIRVTLVNSQCNEVQALAQAIKVRIWLRDDSPLRGRPEATIPVTGPNGTTSLDWWQ